MATTNYYAKFYYGDLGGLSKIPFAKYVLQKEYVMIFNECADIANDGMIDRINDEFYKLYEDYDYDNDDGDLYNSFYAEKANEYIIPKVTKRHNEWLIMDYHYEPVDDNLVGVVKGMKEATVTMYLFPGE